MSVDIIGTLFEVEGAALPGFHVNITPEKMIEAYGAFLVTPQPCLRVWAGDDPYNPTLTVCLRFADEAGAAAILNI